MNDDNILPRVKGDFAIRRLRLKDLLRVASGQLVHQMKYLTHLDNILYTNIMAYGIIHGHNTIQDLRRTGIFNDFATFIEMSTIISGYFKRIPICNDNTKIRLCEINCLTGFLQNDLPGWDFQSEFESLAKGGNMHGWIGENWEMTFKRLADKVMTAESLPDFITFEDYIKEGLWLTAGSSSIGKVTWTKNDESGTFKARKNMLTELYSDLELIRMVHQWDGRLLSRVFTKDELSKRRLAVASNIEAYLSESWILHLYGHGFKNHNYITLDETPKQQHERTSKLIHLLQDGSFCLPFDFKSFDHQPTTIEVQTIITKIADTIKPKCPQNYRATLNKMTQRMVKSYANSIIVNTQTKQQIVQEGGIPSGVRTTSLIGNEWNAIQTTRAREITRLVMKSDLVETIGIKGDDTYVVSKDPVCLAVFRLAYASINAIGLDSKFGISQNICEFLRNEISVKGCQGWPNRAIPSITQRKPWNAQPWSPSADVTTVANNIYLLERRLKFATPKIHHANKIKWSKYTNQSYHWLHLPTHLGGFGLYAFEGWEPNGRLPSTTKPLIEVTNLKTDRDYLPWANITSEQKSAYVAEMFNEKIASDDVAGPQKFYSRDFINILRTKTYVWLRNKISFPIFPVKISCPPISEHVLWPKDKRVNLASSNPKLPIFPEFIRQHQLLKRASERINVTIAPLKDYCRKFFSNQWSDVEYYERNGWHRTDAINLACGSIPTEPLKILHPLLAAFVKDNLRKNKIRYWKGRRNIALSIYSATTLAVQRLQSTGAQHR